MPAAVAGASSVPSAPTAQPVPEPATPYVSGLITTHGPVDSSFVEPFLFDPEGRVVLLHGVNAVYKRPPYEVYVDPGKPWNFDATDASEIARLGFNVVRLGILWEGIEPGTAAPDDPAICSKGSPQDPGQWNQAVADRYLSRVAEVVNLLGQYHVYTLLDMHQDVYSHIFRGEGAPAWAVCTNGIRPVPLPGRWSNNYADPALDAAFANFWTNDVVGELQGEYDRAWGAVAAYFAGNPWVVGYDPINEPFTTALAPAPTASIDEELECFYTGSAHPGTIDGKPAVCPPTDPAEGVVPTILAADPHHLIFREPTIYASHGLPNYVGAMDYPNLVLNFHDYCSFRSGVTGNPYNLSACLNQEDRTFLVRTSERGNLVSATQPHGLPLFMSEFGATESPLLVDGVVRTASEALIGWMYWSWKYYDDPTGSSGEALVDGRGHLRSTAKALAQTYPQAVAGSPQLVNFDHTSGDFYLNYTANPQITAPTLVWVSKHYYYPHGYCATTSAGTILSPTDALVLEVENPSTAVPVVVTITPGKCGRPKK